MPLPSYSAVFVFGDSLSDNGAVFALTNGAIPPSTLTGTDLQGNPVDFAAREIFYNQRFTNGDVYADVVAGLLNIPSDTSTFYDNFSGSNFAVGGATATDLSVIGGTATNTFADQVAAFQGALAFLPGSDAEKEAFLSAAAASVFIGLNDLGALGGTSTAGGTIDQAALATGVGAILQDIAASAQDLAGSGVGTIILNKLPGGSFFPSSNPLIDFFGPGTAELFDSVSSAVNDGIEGIAASLEAQGLNVEIVDFFSLAQEIQADASTFGFLTLETLLPGGSAQTTLLIDDVPIDQVGFLDPVHFTAELHEVFGAFQAMTLGLDQIAGDELGGQTVATSDAEVTFANDGDDAVYSSAGDDLAFGGAGADRLFSGTGDDRMFGGTGDDSVFGGAGDDVVSGGSGDDNVFGGSGSDIVAGNDGDDVLWGGTGGDIISGGLGSNQVIAGAGDDFVIFEDAALIGGVSGAGTQNLQGGDGNDTLLIVTNETVTDVAAYLATQNVTQTGFENIEVLTQDAFDAYDYGALSAQAEIGDLFGFI